MAVSIDEVSAEVTGPPAERGEASASADAKQGRDKVARQQRELIQQLRCRAERVRAD
jgi:hypothetical protein